MDFEQNENGPGPIEPVPAGPVSPPAPQVSATGARPPKKGKGWKIFWGIVTGLSVLTNLALFLMLIGVIAVFATGQREIFIEEVIEEGSQSKKIAVVNINGIIDGTSAQEFSKQLKTVAKDNGVKGLIIRVNSPGGTISGSDQIHNEITKFRKKHQKPVVAFMQGVAASGGYYTSVACEQIVAEPTVITGSIGVIMTYFVVEDLFTDKLGIQTVVVKSAEKKDWPSSFDAPTPEQLEYLDSKLIKPAYQRFVQIVADGRETLDVDNAMRLADGSIYGADEALAEKLIDSVGYLEDAVELVKSLAKIDEAQVVEYRRPFSLSSFLSLRSSNILKISKTSLRELSTPEVLYLWSMY